MRPPATQYPGLGTKVEVRRRLAYPHPIRVSAGMFAEMAIGMSVDEVHRVRDADVAYMRLDDGVLPMREVE